MGRRLGGANDLVQKHHRIADSGSYCGTRDNCEADLIDKRHRKRHQNTLGGLSVCVTLIKQVSHILSMKELASFLIFVAKNLAI